MKAVLRTYDKEKHISDKIVEISDSHDFFGPYADTVPFSVGSNQSILPLTWLIEEKLEE